MSFLDFASRMFPYWILGAFTFYAIWNSQYKDLLSFNLKPFSKFFLFMIFITAYRYFLLTLAVKHGIGLEQLKAVSGLPIGAVFFTPWEDLCHSVPLVLLRRIIGTSKWAFPIHALAMAIVMLSFGLGHTYQGIYSAMFISLYIPFAVNFGQKRGFGTLMACHVLYDFATIMIIKMVVSGL